MNSRRIPPRSNPRTPRVRSSATTCAVCLILAGNALTACEGPNETGSTANASNVATHSLGIDGMHCDSCVKAITAKVTKVEGVRSCTVDLATESATIDASPEAMPVVREAIARLGFTVRDPDPTTTSAAVGEPDAKSNTVPDGSASGV